jgi:hypothetical protein
MTRLTWITAAAIEGRQASLSITAPDTLGRQIIVGVPGFGILRQYEFFRNKRDHGYFSSYPGLLIRAERLDRLSIDTAVHGGYRGIPTTMQRESSHQHAAKLGGRQSLRTVAGRCTGSRRYPGKRLWQTISVPPPRLRDPAGRRFLLPRCLP